MPWLQGALNPASRAHFGRPMGYVGQIGTIPPTGMLQLGFAAAKVMNCMVPEPESHVHESNEFLLMPQPCS